MNADRMICFHPSLECICLAEFCSYAGKPRSVYPCISNSRYKTSWTGSFAPLRLIVPSPLLSVIVECFRHEQLPDLGIDNPGTFAL